MTLQSDIQTIIDESGIQAGVSVWHIERDEQIDVNGDQPFPMASVFKIPILATAGKQLKEGRISLDTRIELKDADKSAGSGILPYFEAGLNPTVRDLLTLMIIISDNTATDMTVELLGGAEVVEGYMHELGLGDIYFKMNCKDLLKTLFPADVAERPLEEIRDWAAENDIVRDGTAFSTGPDNNVSTANAMTQLVHMIFQSEIVDGAIRDELLNILLKQQFNVRLSRFLPPNVAFAHKTGTIGGIRNDSGVIYINDDSHVIVTLFVWWDDQAVWQQPEAEHQRIFEVETAMGKIGKLVYDHYNNL